MSGSRVPFPPNEQSKVALRLLRLAAGASVTIRTIDSTYGGLMTHHTQKRSIYCVGDECPVALHKISATWKGYAGVEQWDSERKVWFPTVLEMTECMELDFRERWARGQVWRVERAAKVKKNHNPPLKATFLERCELDKLRKPFDIRPPILTVYHVTEVDLGVKSPVPGRVYLEAVQGAPPPDERKKAAEKDNVFRGSIRELEKQMANGFKSPE